jgi:hypothetical protein
LYRGAVPLYTESKEGSTHDHVDRTSGPEGQGNDE